MGFSSLDILDRELQKHPNVICIYGDKNYTSSSYLNFVIQFLHKNIPIHRLHEQDFDEIRLGKSKASIQFPAFVIFSSGSSPIYYDGAPDPLSLLSWIQSFFSTNIRAIHNLDTLRYLFLGHQSFVLGVDQKEPPSNFPKDLIFYSCPLHFLSLLNLTTITSGFYVYRSSDRQLVRVNGNPRPYMKSHLIDVEVDHISKPYLMGYAIDPTNDTSTSQSISILSQLANQFESEFDATLIDGEMGLKLLNDYRLAYIKKPFFFVLDRHPGSLKRWVILKELYSKSTLQDFLTQIQAGQINETIISAPQKNGFWNYYQLSSNCYKPKSDVLILIGSSDMPDFEDVFNIYTNLALVLNDSEVQTIYYNLQENDPPKFFNDSDLPKNEPQLYFLSKINASLQRFQRPYSTVSLLYLIKMNLSSTPQSKDWTPLKDLHME